MDWKDEEQKLWALEMAESHRYFVEALRAGLLAKAATDDLKGCAKNARTRSRSVTARSQNLREDSKRLREASAQFRADYQGPSLLSLFRTNVPGAEP
jgi:hypothetical protein